MNLLGMKRKLLPYGMPLGGGGAALGAMGSPSPSSGGKSAPPAQNSYSPSFGGQSAAPTSAAPPSGGGKSSGLGQGGYGGAPAFQQPQQAMQQANQQASNPYGAYGDAQGGTFEPLRAPDGRVLNPFETSSNYVPPQNATQQGMGGGKSSGLGQGGYGGAPGFGGQQASMGTMDMPYNGPRNVQDLLVSPQQGGMGDTGMNRAMPSGITPTAAQRDALGMPPLSSNLNKSFGGPGNMEYRGGPSTPAQNAFRAQREQQMGGQQQFNPYQQQQFNPYQQQQFNPYQQQQFNPFQQQFGGFQQQPQFQQPQQDLRGIQDLFSRMMSQQQMQQRPMQQMPQYRNPALQYRPNMQNAQSALSRVRPSVQRQGQDAQAARIAELEAQIAAFQPQTPTDYGYSGG